MKKIRTSVRAGSISTSPGAIMNHSAKLSGRRVRGGVTVRSAVKAGIKL